MGINVIQSKPIHKQVGSKAYLVSSSSSVDERQIRKSGEMPTLRSSCRGHMRGDSRIKLAKWTPKRHAVTHSIRSHTQSSERTTQAHRHNTAPLAVTQYRP